MRPLLLAAATLVAVSLGSSPASARVWEKTWQVEASPRIHVHTNDASVRVVRGPGASVHARVEYEVRVWGWHSEPREPLVEMKQEGADIRITARDRGTVVVFGGVTEKFRVEVTVPEDCVLDLNSGDGAIEVDPGRGELSVRSGDGRITVNGFRGKAALVSADGGIAVDDFDGSLDASTTDGGLRVSGRFDRLALSTGDGRVRATALPGSRLAEPWDLRSGDGSVSLLIPRGLKARLDASTGDGSLNVDLPVDVSGGLTRNRLRGELNGGTMPLTLTTRDGSISLGVSN